MEISLAGAPISRSARYRVHRLIKLKLPLDATAPRLIRRHLQCIDVLHAPESTRLQWRGATASQFSSHLKISSCKSAALLRRQQQPRDPAKDPASSTLQQWSRLETPLSKIRTSPAPIACQYELPSRWGQSPAPVLPASGHWGSSRTVPCRSESLLPQSARRALHVQGTRHVLRP